MKLKMRIRSTLAALAAFSLCTAAQAQISDGVVKIGFLTDLSGIGADLDGPGGVEAVRMAIADMGGAVRGKKIEFLVADHQNKADVAAGKAREWFDQEGLDVLIGGVNSAVNLALARVARDKKKPLLVVGAGTSVLTNEQCSPYTVHWAFDTVALAKGTGTAVVRAGGRSWFFLTADYAFGHALEKDTAQVVKAAGGEVLGSARHPVIASDFSSFILQAQASRAQILALANAAGDTINAIKAAEAFGVTRNMTLAGLLIMITDVHSLGLKATQGMYVTDSWYWNQSAETRAWGRRFFGKMKRMPTSVQAADYSAALQYLQAVKATGSDDADTVLAHLRKTRINDVFAKNGYIRDDGRMVHDMYLMQVKKPEESIEPWDYYNVVETLKGEAAWTTKAESKCALWK